MSKQPPSVLIVDDDLSIRELLTLTLRAEGYETTAAEDGPTALELLQDPLLSPAVAVIDHDLPGMDGLTLAIRLHERVPGIKVVMISGRLPSLVARSALRSGLLSAYLEKPWPRRTLLAALEEAMATEGKRVVNGG